MKKYLAIQRKLVLQSQVRINRIDNNHMTSLQIKHGFGKTASGNLNKKQEQGKFKQIQLGNDDIEMFSPQFLQSKTLKKPLHDYGLYFNKSNSAFLKPQSDKTKKNPIPTDLCFDPSKSMEDFNTNLNQTQKINYTYIALNSTNQIRPAYKPIQEDETMKNMRAQGNSQFSLDDNNTIFSAMMKKGSKPQKSIIFADPNQKYGYIKPVEVQRKVGKAENKLKQLFNKDIKPLSFTQSEGKKPEQKRVIQSEDIDEQIHQSFNQYGEEGFENYSGESGIKQSIRQDLAASSGSGFIKQSIREQFATSSHGKDRKNDIMEEIQESIRASRSAIKQQIPEFISSFKSSKNNIKEEIFQSLEASRKSGEEVYEEIFEEYEDSLKNSRNAFKKSNIKERDSDVLSKSFRKKTNVVKSIKFAQEINNQSKLQISQGGQKKSQSENKYSQQLQQEKNQLLKKKTGLSEFLNKRNQPYEIPQKNKNLIFQFKVQLNKLLTGQNFQSKLRRLTSFINFGQSETKNSINALQDNILKNILTHINSIKKPEISSDQIIKLQADYDQKLTNMLKDQQINLRVEMDKKLHQKDIQLKRMIAELEKKFEGKAFASSGAKYNNFGLNQQNSQMHNSGLYEAQSDYSIDSDNVSWKADLWEVLPEFQKRKLYQKQTKQVTNFLTEIMMNQLKEQSLGRDLDISFQFPDEFNDSQQSRQKISNFPPLSSSKKIQSTEDFMPKSAFNRKQFDENLSVSASPKKQSIFPDFQRPKQASPQQIELSKKQNVNQYSKIDGEIVPESTKKLKMQKQKILQVLSKYKSAYIRKKNDVIRKILKTLKPKDMKKVPSEILSVIQQITILSKQDINANDMVYIRAYEQELIWALTNIMVKNENKKTQVIQEEMRKNYERLVVVCQAKAAQNAEEVVCLSIYEENPEFSKLKNNINSMGVKPCPLQIAMKEEAVQLIQKKEEKSIKNQLVDDIISILMSQFAREIPKRKK